MGAFERLFGCFLHCHWRLARVDWDFFLYMFPNMQYRLLPIYVSKYAISTKLPLNKIHRDSIVEAILNIGSDLIWTQCKPCL
nr:hypothetical protein Itr_chr08CG12140 [Ipomoea trifida]